MGKNLTELGKQIVNLDLIEIKEKKPVANTETLDIYITELTNYVDESIKNDLDVEVVESKIKEIKTAFNGYIDYRKSFTTPLDSVKKKLISKEKCIDKQIDRLAVRREEMLETTYKIAEASIRQEFERLQAENDNIVPDMTVFNSFLEAQRKVKGMLPNEKGVLGKASLEKIEKEFEKHVAPIREARRVEDLKASEQKQFEMYLENLNVSSNDINELEAVVINLVKMKDVIPDFYPNIIDQCNRTIDNKIGLANSNIATLKAREAEAKAEAKVEEMNNADKEALAELQVVKDKLSDMTLTKDDLKEHHETLSALYKKMTFAENQEKVRLTGISVNDRITAIDKAELEEKKKSLGVEEVSETFTVRGTAEDMKALVRFMKERGMRYE